MRSFAPIAFAAAVLCGCSFDSKWSQQSFAFSVPEDPPAAHPPKSVIALTRVSVSPLFQGRSFTYRTGEDRYERDPYARFMAQPERAMGEAIRGWLGASGAFGRVLEPGGSLAPTLAAEATVNELCGDLRDPAHPVAVLQIRLIIYEVTESGPGAVLLDKTINRETPMAHKNPAALMAGWDADLREIMEQMISDYVKASPDLGGPRPS
jgi:cholesterol transport system auxiliary component